MTATENKTDFTIRVWRTESEGKKAMVFTTSTADPERVNDIVTWFAVYHNSPDGFGISVISDGSMVFFCEW